MSFYGFPRRSPRIDPKLRRFSVACNGTQTQFVLPTAASLRHPIRGYFQTASAFVMILPETMQLVRGYRTEDAVRAATAITGTGTAPGNIGDGDDTTAWAEYGPAAYTPCYPLAVIDLGGSSVIARITVTSDLLRSVVIAASDDQAQWTPIGAPMDFSTNGTLLTRAALTATQTPFRYWRVACTAMDWWSWGSNYGARVQRVSLYPETGTISAITFATAPATGTLILEYVAA